MVGFNFQPRLWASCLGGILPISQNSALFSLIGTSYGGDGRVTMGLPNLAASFPLHCGGGNNRGPGLSSHLLGERGGIDSHVLGQHQMPVHQHKIYATTGSAKDTTDVASNSNLATTRDSSLAFTKNPPGSGQEVMANQTLKARGSSYPVNNRQPYLVTNFIICLDGIYPSRN
ncbi:phage tail protein [Shewanella sp. 10N.286.45.A1]|uniref:phage tail protein n=1 Tax=Shewanella sp. 10N.286.45.A1 TaxID=3229694 RepID=UPI0035531258